MSIDLYIVLLFLRDNADLKYETISKIVPLDDGLFHIWVKIT